MSQGLAQQPVNPAYGVVPIVGADELFRREEEVKKRAAEAKQAQPVLTNLAGFVRRCWEDAVTEKQTVEKQMRDALAQRRGEYTSEKLSKIRKSGGSEIYMMLTSVKCRAAAAWLRDALLGTGQDKPWGLAPTPMPEIPPDVRDVLVQQVHAEAQQVLSMGGAITPELVMEIAQQVREKAEREVKEEARRAAEATEQRIEDVMAEGGFTEAFDAFIDDLVTFKAAFLKGPIVRKQIQHEWEQDQSGEWVAVAKEKLVTVYERVSPFDIYPMRGMATVDEGGLIQHHRLTRQSLSEMRGTPGYDTDAINGALDAYGRGGLIDWLAVDPRTGDKQGQESIGPKSQGTQLIDALEYSGSVPGRLLVEWGVPRASVQDLNQEYQANVWLIGTWVIKATLNHDPFGKKPYHKACYESIPGAFWGNGIPDLIRDVQDVCNAAARALVNNMGIASGPQVWVNVDRVPPEEQITSMYPWKIWQTTSDIMGSSAAPVGFFQPNLLAGELLGVFDHFSKLADDYSGIPRYMSGNENVGGAGRTASGMSMMINNASKLIKQVVNNIDRLTISLLRMTHNQLLSQRDPAVRGDIQFVPKGAAAVLAREAVQVRRNEFLATTGNPVDMQIVGMKGRAAVLREQAKLLGMNADDIVPALDDVELQEKMMMMANQAQMAAPAQGGDSTNPQLDKQGGRPAAATMDRVA